ncbi:HK97 family phage prohead protease [Mariluticola halotolerans]|uniref:HK97 family phage prohead protease n=1 Tax=Mariluticola halotolerans TaxID=2909283 RepID=UPI0026E203C4|nr:HK97 family phage prohead protease [Mariluticola halotolerans]UJQ95734.1 HK97 family phage prohead protease [Mariluticola halotolerans]
MSATIAIDETGRFAGYASLFGQVDQGGDIVMPGAFAKSLKAKGQGGVRLLFQHDPKEPIGIWEHIAEDRTGLWAEGRLLPGVERGDALRRLIEGGAIDGLSIGFRTQRATREAATGHRRLWQIDLWEISIVTFPMMDGARIARASAPVASARQTRPLEATISAAIHLLRN